MAELIVQHDGSACRPVGHHTVRSILFAVHKNRLFAIYRPGVGEPIGHLVISPRVVDQRLNRLTLLLGLDQSPTDKIIHHAIQVVDSLHGGKNLVAQIALVYACGTTVGFLPHLDIAHTLLRLHKPYPIPVAPYHHIAVRAAVEIKHPLFLLLGGRYHGFAKAHLVLLAHLQAAQIQSPRLSHIIAHMTGADAIFLRPVEQGRHIQVIHRTRQSHI